MTYDSDGAYPTGRGRVHRSSHSTRTAEGWLCRFHQGTPVLEPERPGRLRAGCREWYAEHFPEDPMTYAAGWRLFDADSHIMELPDFLQNHADPGLRDRIPAIDYSRSSMDEDEGWRLARAGGHDRGYANELEALGGVGLIRGPKEEKALGAFDAADRTRALDLLGFEKQLVFSTLSGTVVFDRRLDGEIQYGAARAHNRGMAAFCAADARLMAVASIPLQDPEASVRELDTVIRDEMHAVWVPHGDAGGRSPGHVDFDPFWARLAEAGIPFVIHVPFEIPIRQLSGFFVSRHFPFQ